MFYTHRRPCPQSAKTQKIRSVSLRANNPPEDLAKMLFGALLGSMWEGLGPLLGLSWAVLGRSWLDLGHSCVPFGLIWDGLGRLLGTSWLPWALQASI